MKEHICLCCGEPFMDYESSKRKYCSKNCSMKKRWESKEKAKKIKLICRNCNKEFELKASETRVKENKVHYCSAKCRDEARKTGKIKECPICGKSFYTTRNEFCSTKCSNEYISKNRKHNLYMENGYLIKFKNGYNKKGNAKLHRLIMEEHLGRKLTSNEIVHHIDGNKLNNDITNLKVMTRGEHSRLHRKQELESGKKLFCRSQMELEEV